MCLLIAKPEGVDLPSNEYIQNALDNNPDGFGLAYVNSRGKVHISKGAMLPSEVFDMLAKVPNAKDKLMLLHFRLATHGSTSRGNCHPFPLSEDDKALTNCNYVCDMAVAHNGIIYDMPTNYQDGKVQHKMGLSDTQKFIKYYLSKMALSSLFDTAVMNMIEAFTNSKFAFLTSEGIRLIGDFIEDGGAWYSNESYKKQVMTYMNYAAMTDEQWDAWVGEGKGATGHKNSYKPPRTNGYDAADDSYGYDYCDLCQAVVAKQNLIVIGDTQACTECLIERLDNKMEV